MVLLETRMRFFEFLMLSREVDLFEPHAFNDKVMLLFDWQRTPYGERL